MKHREQYRQASLAKLKRYEQGDIFIAQTEVQRRYGLAPRKYEEIDSWSTTSIHAVLHALEGGNT